MNLHRIAGAVYLTASQCVMATMHEEAARKSLENV